MKNVGETDAALLQQARIGRDLQQDLMRMRAVPFSQLAERLSRIVRQSAAELGRKAELTIEGAQVELDRGVLERVAAPLEHMLRNALVHGIEAPALRAAAGKPEPGRIAISLRQEANEVVLALADDGAGLDLERLRAKAVEKGMVAAENQRPFSIEVANGDGYTRPPLHDFFMTRYTEAYANEIASFIAAVEKGAAITPSGAGPAYSSSAYLPCRTCTVLRRAPQASFMRARTAALSSTAT